MPWDFIGAKNVLDDLSNMLLKNRLPHAILISGQAGSGKYTLARNIAQALFCTNQDASKAPCLTCHSCQKLLNNVHPDFKFFEPTGRNEQIKIEDIRTLKTEINIKPYEGPKKIFVIKKAERLLADAGNALLKTLEEPPGEALIILTTSSAADMMPTIVSRCRLIKLPPIDTMTITNEIQLNTNLNAQQAALIATLADGSLGFAKKLNAKIIYDLWLNIDKNMENLFLNNLSSMHDWINSLNNIENLLLDNSSENSNMDDESKNTLEEKHFPLIISIVRLWWRQTFKLYAGALNVDDSTKAQRSWANILQPNDILNINQFLDALAYSLKRYVKMELAFENYCLKILSLKLKNR